MGKLLEGEWVDEWYDTDSHGGRFVREDAGFRDWVRADGSSRFSPAAGRYHLYVSLACPWAHRTLIFRKLKGLEDAIDVSVVHWYMGANGWTFESEEMPNGATGDRLHGKLCLHELYTAAKPDYTGRVTVPVLWDTQENTIVSNESAEIIRMFNHEFEGVADPDAPDFYPEHSREEIDEVNALVYDRINNGVYKTGFATTQEAYEAAFKHLFEGLDEIEKRLTENCYLVGDTITEADWRLFTTLIRFDVVYFGHFKCNRQRIADFPNIQRFMQALYRQPGIADTVNFRHIKSHYYGSHEHINPTGIIPAGPDLKWIIGEDAPAPAG